MDTTTPENIVLYLPGCTKVTHYLPTLHSASPPFSLYPLDDSLPPHIREKARALAVKLGVPIPPSLLSSLPSLEIVSMFGVGYDNVPVDYCVERGVIVTHTPNVLNECVADLVVGMVVGVGRELVQADKYLREGRWEREGPFPLATKVSKKKVGVVGMGRIGRVIGERLEKGLGMEIYYHSRTKKDDLPESYKYSPTIEELADQVQFLVVIVPGGEKTKNMVGEEVFKRLGKDGYVVNVARGSVVDEDALVKCLKDGTIKGAALDVYVDEPRVSQQLRDLPNVLLVPHIGSATNETRQAMAQLVSDNLSAFFEGRPLPSPVPECQK